MILKRVRDHLIEFYYFQTCSQMMPTLLAPTVSIVGPHELEKCVCYLQTIFQLTYLVAKRRHMRKGAVAGATSLGIIDSSLFAVM